jgi:hemoglobin
VTDDTPLLEPHRVYDRVGGLDAFETLVEAFYRRVEEDPLLRPIYPDDLEPGKRGLARFLAQYFGGGDLYSREKGHPRLRMRHAPFAVTPEAALRWATLMSEAIREQRFDADVERVLVTYVAQATPTLVNALPDGADPLPRA